MTPLDGFVRLCEQADLKALRRRDPRKDPSLADKYYELQKQEQCLFAIAFLPEGIAGTAVLDTRPGQLAPELKNLWVHPEHRRRGAGRALTTFLEAHAAKAGFEEIFLSLDPDNFLAMPLYLDLEYSPTGHHRETIHDWDETQGESPDTPRWEAIYRKSLLMSD